MKRNSALKSIAALAVTLTASAVLSASSAQAADAYLKQILDRGVVRVGVQGAFKPWSFPAPDGSMQGIEVDLAQSVADALGVELEPVMITSANRMQFLQQGKIDLIIGGMYDTAERRKVIGIIEPAYWSSGPTLLAKEDVINDWKDIAGKPVCGKQGNYYNKQVETEYDATIISFTGNTEAKQALRDGKCIAWLYDDAPIMADLASGEWEGYEMAVPVLYDNPWAAAVPLPEVDKAWGVFMSGMAYRWQASGTLVELEKKWKVKPSDWIAAQHEKAQWDTSYLQGGN
ncbi:transporter substrate-binding domain-containing protein [Allomesorhizobium alhagi]|uniref:Extracellular solute-binding protein n=1 Tax=Mesorhizobium alhagi CCNWXJ12-2 TaxID=1107882 RepID=H0HYD1_9HYPH|nr:transporter substrate-binding domain-containing protein [Mesorhizobium alhagi]EHK54269.1 extracellular solute-binding protein [Mesorhizobium alhagi CCNWXJ12-2]